MYLRGRCPSGEGSLKRRLHDFGKGQISTRASGWGFQLVKSFNQTKTLK